jgi:hypothetical protein
MLGILKQQLSKVKLSLNFVSMQKSITIRKIYGSPNGLQRDLPFFENQATKASARKKTSWN